MGPWNDRASICAFFKSWWDLIFQLVLVERVSGLQFKEDARRAIHNSA